MGTETRFARLERSSRGQIAADGGIAPDIAYQTRGDFHRLRVVAGNGDFDAPARSCGSRRKRTVADSNGTNRFQIDMFTNFRRFE